MIVSTLELELPWREQLDIAAGEIPVIHATLASLSEKQLAQVEVLFTYGYDLTEERLQAMPALRWVHIGQSGMERLPMRALDEKGIMLTNSRGINAIAISEYVMSMMLNIVRRNKEFYEAQKAGLWDVETHLDELYGKTLGILGLGKVGSELARRAGAFEMRVLGMDVAGGSTVVEKVYLPEERKKLLSQCDFVAICMPLTPQTHHFISEAEFQCMRPEAWLINVGRGAIVDEQMLLKALGEKRIGGAVLDVFEHEPLDTASSLWKMPNVCITPHIAGDHLASYMPRMMKLLCDNLSRYLDGEELQNQVNVRRGF